MRLFLNFKTIADLDSCIVKNLHKIPRDIDLVVGIPRSGMLAATIIALHLNLPLLDMDSYLNQVQFHTGNTKKCENWIKTTQEAKKVLVVDDSISSGKAMNEAKMLTKRIASVKHFFLAVYALELTSLMVDIFFEIVSQPRMFEWNFMHHWALEYACVDIDGVLCEDPTFFQNDDGKRYREFIENAAPKFIPTKKVAYIVSARLEKYRKETEEWLHKNKIEYGKLILLDEPDAASRRKNVNHGSYKGEIFKNTDCSLFIESSYEQAVEICRTSGKQCYCTGKACLITPEGVTVHLKILANDWRFTAKRIVKKLLKLI